jgi:probable HAF family extracellular repeat protein
MSHAFVWTHRTGMVDLGTLGGFGSAAQAVSDKGIVVGNSQTATGENHAFAWTRHTGMIDIGTAGLQSFAEKIVDRVAIGQTFTLAGTKHGFAWTRRGGLVDLGTLGGDVSFAAAVNEEGTVVGGSWTKGNAAFRAFAWSPSSGMVPLDTPGGGTSQATALNDDVIVGSSCSAGDVTCHATLWKPSFHSPRD